MRGDCYEAEWESRNSTSFFFESLTREPRMDMDMNSWAHNFPTSAFPGSWDHRLLPSLQGPIHNFYLAVYVNLSQF